MCGAPGDGLDLSSSNVFKAPSNSNSTLSAQCASVASMLEWSAAHSTQQVTTFRSNFECLGAGEKYGK